MGYRRWRWLLTPDGIKHKGTINASEAIGEIAARILKVLQSSGGVGIDSMPYIMSEPCGVVNVIHS
jgi:hypothetical protein